MSEESLKYSVRGFYVGPAAFDDVQHGFFSSFGLGNPKDVKKYAYAYPDLDSLIKNLQDACNECDDQGYDIETILPLNIGSVDEYLDSNNRVVNTASYSVTRGVLLVAKRRD